MSLYCSVILNDENSHRGTCKGPTVPLTFLKQGEIGSVLRVSGREETRKHLTGLGFIAGTEVKVVSINNSGLILDVRGSRIAVDKSLASMIFCYVE